RRRREEKATTCLGLRGITIWSCGKQSSPPSKLPRVTKQYRLFESLCSS
ncbi:10368_t:CDS:1, partial [Scutellospora calospora]